MTESPSERPSVLKFARMLMALEADASFQSLRASQSRPNMFRIVGTTDKERWHSAFWSWILDPEGSHGLGDFAVLRLLMRTFSDDGRLRGVRLEPGPSPESEFHWHASSVDDISSRPSLSEITNWRVTRSAAAPGPLSSFSEVTSRRAVEPGQRKSGDDNRFDILLVAQGDHPGGQRGHLTFYIVVEMKVGAKYDPAQLGRYARWVYEDPSAADLCSKDGNADLVSRIDELAKIAQVSDKDSETWGVGVFLSRARPDPSPRPEELIPQWSDVRFSDLVEDILEGALRHSDLHPSAKPLLQNYIDLVADPTMEILSMPPSEHRELVESLYRRHPDTFRIIAKVLAAPHDREVEEIGQALDGLKEEQESLKRAQSLTPQRILDEGFAKIGDRLEHVPIKNRALGTKPFEKSVVVELGSGDRAGFRLVDGPADVGNKLFTSTGALQEVYSRSGAKFSSSGNASLTFVSGDSTGRTLEQVYADVREREASSKTSG